MKTPLLLDTCALIWSAMGGDQRGDGRHDAVLERLPVYSRRGLVDRKAGMAMAAPSLDCRFEVRASFNSAEI